MCIVSNNNLYLHNNTGIIKSSPIPKSSAEPKFIWSRFWGGSNFETGYDTLVDNSGNIYAIGSTMSYGAGDFDVLLLKYDSNGNLLWNITCGGSGYEEGKAIVLDNSGDIYVAGVTTSYGAGNLDVYLLKYNSSGDLQWSTTWGGPDNDRGEGIAIDNSGNIYITGDTVSFGSGSNDVLLLKVNASTGNEIWNKTWGGSNIDIGYDLCIFNEQNITITGRTNSFGAGNDDLFLLNYNSSGDLLWNITWGTSLSEEGAAITLDNSGNYYIAGKIYLSTSDHVSLLLKFNSQGNYLFNSTWFLGVKADPAFGIVLYNQSDLFLCGRSKNTTNYDIFLLNYDLNGNLLFNFTWGSSGYEEAMGISTDNQNNLYITGYTENLGDNPDDIFILKYDLKDITASSSDNNENENNKENDEKIDTEVSIIGYNNLLLIFISIISISLIIILKKKK